VPFFPIRPYRTPSFNFNSAPDKMSDPLTFAFAFDFRSGVEAPELGSADEAMLMLRSLISS
jgi:hypothetical protein